jgi:hypothetical protein
MSGFNFFYPTLIKGLGYTNTTKILLLTVPPYFVAFVASLCASRDRFRRDNAYGQ